MATIQGSTKQDKISIKQFKGIFESPDGDTQIKLGIATEMRNFAISDSYHLVTRPGIAVQDYRAHKILCIWSGYYQKRVTNIVVWDDRIMAVLTDPDAGQAAYMYTYVNTSGHVTIFDFGGNIYMLTGGQYYKLVIDLDSELQRLTRTVVEGYIPLVVTGAVPSGGGTNLERANLLTNKRRIQFSADGTSTVFVLPEKATELVKVVVDNVEVSGWTVGTGANADQVTAPAPAPPQGINNVEITYAANTESEVPERSLITSQKYAELFNGSTDGRVFLYGDGTNITYYSGITEAGAPSAEYFPALNEIAVGAGNSPIVAMARHYTRLMAFKPDSTYAISYDTIWLADNTATAGFYLRPMHRELGADAEGQVVTADNFLRTFCRGNIYEWRQTASYYQDERYARVVSGPVQNTIRKADRKTIYFYDDDRRHRFFAFLNDNEGTVLVNDYQLDVWYKWTGFHGVYHMERTPTDVLYFSMAAPAGIGVNTDMLCVLSEKLSYDYMIEPDMALHQHMINCYWESGHMAFGSESTRKYSSYVWVTLLAGPGAVAVVKTRTDRKPQGPEKTDWANTTGLFDATEFDRFSFQTYLAPFARRLKLKLKKFVYYKLIIESEPREDGLDVFEVWDEMPWDDKGSGSVCVLNIDIKVRNGPDAK